MQPQTNPFGAHANQAQMQGGGGGTGNANNRPQPMSNPFGMNQGGRPATATNPPATNAFEYQQAPNMMQNNQGQPGSQGFSNPQPQPYGQGRNSNLQQNNNNNINSAANLPQQMNNMSLNQPVQTPQPVVPQQQQPLFEGEPMDEYCSDKALLRLTTDRIPSSQSLAQECQIPIGLIVKPYGELSSGEEIPTASFKNKPVIRCAECRAYINPFVRWQDGGQKWTCNFCGAKNQTEQYYYSELDENGYRLDLEHRPELMYGSIDYIASVEYMNRPPMPPTFIFCFDVSQPAVDSGYIQQAAYTIKGALEEGAMPGQDRMRVCFLAYDKNLYYFNLRSTLKNPQMIICTDSVEPFLPQQDDLLVNLNDSYDLVLSLLENFHNYFANSMAPKTMETAFVPAIQVAHKIAESIGGKLMLFQAGPKAAQHPQLLTKATDKVDAMSKFGPSSTYFANTASQLAHQQISVDMFIFSLGKGQFKNLATFGELSQKSSGTLHFYPEFNVQQGAMKFTNELYHCLTRRQAWEAVFRVRTTLGFAQTGTYGNHLVKERTTDLILCPTLDKDKVFMYELERQGEHQMTPEKRQILLQQTHIYIQSALLYTTAEGERRIRVHNACYPLTNIKHKPFEYLDTTALVAFWARKQTARLAVNQFNFSSTTSNLELALQCLCKAFIRLGSGNIEGTEKGKLSDDLQYLVLYTYGLIKTTLLSPIQQLPLGDPYLDKIAHLKHMLNNLGADEVNPMFHPQIYNIADEFLTGEEFPAMEMLTRGSFTQDGIFLAFNAQSVYLFIGSRAPQNLLYQLFQVSDPMQVDLNLSEDAIFSEERMAGSAYLTAIYGLINQIRYQRTPFCQLKLLREGDQETEKLVGQMCVMDNRGFQYMKDYNKFLAECAVVQPGSTGLTGRTSNPGVPGGYY